MNARTFAGALAICASVFSSGCKVTVVNPNPIPGGPPGTVPFYGLCNTTTDCNSAIDSCVPITSGLYTDSQCTHPCGSSAECGNGVCISVGGNGAAQCFQSCQTSAQCQVGWTCQSFDGVPVCLPGEDAGPVGLPTYARCSTATTSCGYPDQCVPFIDGAFNDSICTRTCRDSLECGAGGVCADFGATGGGAYCLRGCPTGTECLTGWSCELQNGVPVCLPGQPTPLAIPAYDECIPDYDQCEVGTECFYVSYLGNSTGLCTRGCTRDLDCPIDPRGYSGACRSFDGFNASCFESCVGPLDCAAGWFCAPPDSTGVSICLPN